MFKKILLLLSFCLLLLVTTFGQERERELPSRPDPPPREEPRSVEPPRNEPPPRNDPPPPPREEPRRTDNSSSNDSSNDNNSNSRERRRERDPGEGNGRVRKGDDDFKKPNPPQRPPVVDPTPTPNPNPVPPGNSSGRNKDNEDREEERRRRNRNRNGGYYPPVYYPNPTPTTPTTFSWRVYFDKDDVFFNVYNTYVEANSANYLPFFDAVLGYDFQPLYYIYGREFYRNEFPFVSGDWTIYYEPDLDDIFVDFDKFGKVGYERMVIFAVGDTIKKVNKKFDYKGQTIRPLLVETLPLVDKDKLYSFNVKDLPKGEYEIRFIARDGTTLKHSIRLK